jgi:hypothetical protein
VNVDPAIVSEAARWVIGALVVLAWLALAALLILVGVVIYRRNCRRPRP